MQGPNGAGKTTLLSALISRNPPEKGKIFFHGREISSRSQRQDYLARTAYLGHEPGLFYDLTAIENLQFFHGLFYNRVQNQNNGDKINTLLARCSLEFRKNDPVRSFSRGMKQRLALARVFLQEADIIFADEPLTGLDKKGEKLLLELLETNKALNRAAIIVTHDETLFRNIADRFIFLNDGRIIADVKHENYNERTKRKIFEMLYEKNNE